MSTATAKPGAEPTNANPQASDNPQASSVSPAVGTTEDTARGTVEVDDESDSTFGDDYASETTSLNSSILEHKYENGRTYHSYKAGKYIMPNDKEEEERLDIHHHLALLQLDGELYAAPIGNSPGRVLDLGTGTGLWAIDMGDKFPNAKVIGADLSPPGTAWVPPNVSFEVDDIEEEWTYSDPFDFIHARFLAGSIYNWEKLVKNCFDNIKPGGWVEFKDWDPRPRDPSGSIDIPRNYVKLYHDETLAACKDLGVDPCPPLFLNDLVRKAGFTKIQEKVFIVPAGEWPKDKKLKTVGKFYGVTMYEGAPAIALRLLTQVRGWAADEVHVLCAQFRNDMKKFPFYHKYHVIWAQKPEDASKSS